MTYKTAYETLKDLWKQPEIEMTEDIREAMYWAIDSLAREMRECSECKNNGIRCGWCSRQHRDRADYWAEK